MKETRNLACARLYQHKEFILQIMFNIYTFQEDFLSVKFHKMAECSKHSVGPTIISMIKILKYKENDFVYIYIFFLHIAFWNAGMFGKDIDCKTVSETKSEKLKFILLF